MRLLLSNDDGIFSPGLHALAEVAAGFGEVVIVAPDVEQSSMSHAITGSRPLTCRRTSLASFEAYRVNGTPADCVALGLAQHPDTSVVLSGINLGLNVGNAVWHSGTLAAAKQAALLGKRGIAFSAPATEDVPDYTVTKARVKEVLELALPQDGWPLLNVNIPDEPVGVCWARQSVRHYDGHILPAKDPMGREHFWFAFQPVEQVEPGTDRWAVEHRYVSVTPLRLDLTDESALKAAQTRYGCQADGALPRP